MIEKKGVNPLVVVPADPKNVGGGFAGSASLEEQFYRRTTGLLAVEGDFKVRAQVESVVMSYVAHQYDIPEHGGIYLPQIQVFRDGESRTGYQLVKAPRKVAFLLASSLAKPKYEPKGRSFVLAPDDRAQLEAKATAILNAGIEKGHDAIVLSAFGCGFNQAPPQAVAAVFRDLLTGKFSNTYKVTSLILRLRVFCQLGRGFGRASLGAALLDGNFSVDLPGRDSSFFFSIFPVCFPLCCLTVLCST